MSFPFFNAVKGATASAPGTGSFTPNLAATGFLPWSTVSTGWIGLVRYEDGSSWEMCYGHWNGATITRPTNGFVSSSSGSRLSLSDAALAALVVDAGAVTLHPGITPLRTAYAQYFTTTFSFSGLSGSGYGPTGTAASVSPASTNALTEQVRVQYTSATTANALAGAFFGDRILARSIIPGRGGFEFHARFGASQLPFGPRLFVGLGPGLASPNLGVDPSAVAFDTVMFGKDASDTNIQFISNDAGVSAGKTDTGILFIANGSYYAKIWAPPGGSAIFGLLIRVDTGDIWYGSRTVDLPAAGTMMSAYAYGSLSATTGTAIIFHIGSIAMAQRP